MHVLLSHILTERTPSFAGGPSLTIAPIKEIRTGGSSNSYTISLPNHLGTHIDAPRHFDDNGRAVADYPFDAFVFDHPLILDISKDESELIAAEELIGHEAEIAEADLLLLRTGFQACRETDPSKYMNRNPGVSPEAARYLASRFPHLRALGFDFISLSAVQRRDSGREAHRVLLSERDFFIIEDMDLADFPEKARRIIVAPLFIVGVDSTPCTVIAEA